MSEEKRERELFEACLELPEEERKHYLTERCGDNARLRQRIDRLLIAHHKAEASEEDSHPFRSLSTFGPYQIHDRLGTGGMGVVYRATDTRLNREVALKVLPDFFARDHQRMQRFQREAQALAALNHPNIAVIHGLEEAEGNRALVLELVPGQTLAEVIASEPMLLEQALKIALQVAEALEAAHEKRIVHRDLKPANVKITPEGTVKVLDFGLAKALDVEAGTTPAFRSSTLTEDGHVLGTPAYMSPEQAKGESVDHRADIWAFGCLLYEMLTGRQPFKGESVVDVLASVIRAEPDWSAVPPSTPSIIWQLLRRCLEKNPRERLQAIGEFRLVLSRYLADPKGYEPMSLAQSQSAIAGRRWLWAGSAVVTAVLGFALAWVFLPGTVPGPPPSPISVEVPVAAGMSLFKSQSSAAILSPRSDRVAYVTGISGRSGGRFIHLRSLDHFDESVVAGSEGGYNPFFSPDGEWLAFVTPDELKKVPIGGGDPLILCAVNRSRGASWGSDGSIVFASERFGGLLKVAATGGEPEILTTLREGEWSHRWPQFLPGGRQVIFTSLSSPDFNSGHIELVDLSTGQRRLLHEGGTYGRYSKSGHLLFWREGTVYAVAVDPKTGRKLGTPMPVLQGVGGNLEGGAQYDLSPDGTLVYVEGPPVAEAQSPLVWGDKSGKLTIAAELRGAFTFGMKLSADSHFLAVGRNTNGNVDIWVYDLGRDLANRLTFDSAADGNPVWTPDSETLYFASDREGHAQIYRVRADGSTQPERVLESEMRQYPDDVSPDGNHLIFHEDHPETGNDLWVLSLADSAEAQPLLVTPVDEVGARFSPDGRWLAYVSHQSGRGEIYVQPFPGPGGKWQVSREGGAGPRWSDNGSRLFFRQSDRIMSVAFSTEGDRVRLGRPELAFQIDSGILGGLYDLTGDGERYLIVPNQPINEVTEPDRMRLTFFWYEELARLVSAQ